MRKVTSILCAIAFMISGISIANITRGSTNDSGYKTLSAATLYPEQRGFETLPFDVQLDLDKRMTKDSVVVHDTVYVTKPETARVRKPKQSTDYLVMAFNPERTLRDTVSNQVALGREEQPKDVDVGTSKVSTIQLIVDGQVVYTKNDNHSAGEGQ